TQRLDVAARVAGNRDQVGKQPWLDCPETTVPPESSGGGRRGGTEGLCRFHAVVGQEVQLTRSIALGKYNHFTAIDNGDAGFKRLLESGPCVLQTCRFRIDAGSITAIPGRRFKRREGGTKCDTPVGHQLEDFWIAAIAMFNRSNTCQGRAPH